MERLLRDRDLFRDLDLEDLRRFRSRDLDLDLVLREPFLSLVNIPITGSIDALIMFCASLNLVRASSISC